MRRPTAAMARTCAARRQLPLLWLHQAWVCSPKRLPLDLTLVLLSETQWGEASPKSDAAKSQVRQEKLMGCAAARLCPKFPSLVSTQCGHQWPCCEPRTRGFVADIAKALPQQHYPPPTWEMVSCVGIARPMCSSAWGIMSECAVAVALNTYPAPEAEKNVQELAAQAHPRRRRAR